MDDIHTDTRTHTDNTARQSRPELAVRKPLAMEDRPSPAGHKQRALEVPLRQEEQPQPAPEMEGRLRHRQKPPRELVASQPT